LQSVAIDSTTARDKLAVRDDAAARDKLAARENTVAHPRIAARAKLGARENTAAHPRIAARDKLAARDNIAAHPRLAARRNVATRSRRYAGQDGNGLGRMLIQSAAFGSLGRSVAAPSGCDGAWRGQSSGVTRASRGDGWRGDANRGSQASAERGGPME
jgi:hypothetical protein